MRQSQRFFSSRPGTMIALAAAGIIAADLFADAAVQGGDVAPLRQPAAVGGIHHQQHAGRIGGGRVEMEKVGLVDLGERGEAGALEVVPRRGRGSGIDVRTEDLARARRCPLHHSLFQFILQVTEAGGPEGRPALEGERPAAVDGAAGKMAAASRANVPEPQNGSITIR